MFYFDIKWYVVNKVIYSKQPHRYLKKKKTVGLIFQPTRALFFRHQFLRIIKMKRKTHLCVVFLHGQ